MQQVDEAQETSFPANTQRDIDVSASYSIVNLIRSTVFLSQLCHLLTMFSWALLLTFLCSSLLLGEVGL